MGRKCNPNGHQHNAAKTDLYKIGNPLAKAIKTWKVLRYYIYLKRVIFKAAKQNWKKMRKNTAQTLGVKRGFVIIAKQNWKLKIQRDAAQTLGLNRGWMGGRQWPWRANRRHKRRSHISIAEEEARPDDHLLHSHLLRDHPLPLHVHLFLIILFLIDLFRVTFLWNPSLIIALLYL